MKKQEKQGAKGGHGAAAPEKLRILVFGAGVLGANLAAGLHRGGHEVTLLARGGWGEEIRRRGLRIRNALLPITRTYRIPVVSELRPDDRYDAVFVAVRYTQLDSVMAALRANVSKCIIFVGNNVRARALADSLPGKTVLFAFTSSCGKREGNRVVSVSLRKIVIGEPAGYPKREKLVSRIFDGTGYRVTYQPNMGDYLLCHAAYVLPITFACYYTAGNLRCLRRDTAYLNRVVDANVEGYRAIAAAGHEILPAADREFEGAAYRTLCLRFLRLMCATPVGKIAAADHALSAPEEMEALNRDLKALFDSQGASYPAWLSLEAGANDYLS